MALLIFFHSGPRFILNWFLFLMWGRGQKPFFPYGYPTALAPFPQLNSRISPQFSSAATESQFLGRLIRSPGVPKERGVWIVKEEERTNIFFPPLHSLGLYNNNVSCLRTIFGKNHLANPIILKCKLWEWI